MVQLLRHAERAYYTFLAGAALGQKRAARAINKHRAAGIARCLLTKRR